MTTVSMTTPLESVDDRKVGSVGARNWLLNALTVSSGAVDAISFLALGKIFTAFMTGNIAFLGMALARHPGAPRIAAVLASMAGFACGIYIATKITTPTKRPVGQVGPPPADAVWPLRTTVALGISLLAHLGFVAMWLAYRGQPDLDVIPYLLAVWALAMGMQSAAVRKLNVGGIFTTAATATFIFLFSDLANIPLTGDERRRMWGILISLVVGATAGTLLLMKAPIYAPVLPLAITGVVVATAAAIFRRREEASAARVSS